MRKFILGIVMIMTTYLSPGAFAQDTIEWVHAHGAASAATPGYIAVLEEANRLQKKYLFVNQFKPGGDGVLFKAYGMCVGPLGLWLTWQIKKVVQ